MLKLIPGEGPGGGGGQDGEARGISKRGANEAGGDVFSVRIQRRTCPCISAPQKRHSKKRAPEAVTFLLVDRGAAGGSGSL